LRSVLALVEGRTVSPECDFAVGLEAAPENCEFAVPSGVPYSAISADESCAALEPREERARSLPLASPALGGSSCTASTQGGAFSPRSASPETQTAKSPSAPARFPLESVRGTALLSFHPQSNFSTTEPRRDPTGNLPAQGTQQCSERRLRGLIVVVECVLPFFKDRPMRAFKSSFKGTSD
jgi:hypothetical protein